MITAHCKIFFEVKVIPSFIFSSPAKFLNIEVITIPIIIANTGAPITSNENPPIFSPASNVDIPATTAQTIIPIPFFLTKFINIFQAS